MELVTYPLLSNDTRLDCRAKIRSFIRFIKASKFAPSTNNAGVASKVSIVANVSPPAIVLDKSVHHWEDGAPDKIVLSPNWIVYPNTIGNSPIMVVTAVSNTGLNRARPAWNAAFVAS